jgi:purine-nucleoside phosphorylase
VVTLAEYWGQAQAAAAYLRSQGCIAPEIVVQCGSGLAPLIDALWPASHPSRCRFSDVPHLAPTSVAGHGSELLWGEVPGQDGSPRELLVFSGRLHLYEGHTGLAAAFPVAIAKALGCKLFVLTNAAGGLNQHFASGEVMLQRDFINFQGDNPLAHLSAIGTPPAELEGITRFADPKPAYDSSVSRAMGGHLQQEGLKVQEGVYVGVRGPLYETRAELAMLRSFGADAIGMSTIPELTLCHFFQLPVVGISVITNECFAAEVVTHQKVLAGSLAAAQALGRAVGQFAATWQTPPAPPPSKAV